VPREEQVFLGREVVDQRPFRDVGGCGDLGDGHCVVASLAEQGECDVGDPVPGLTSPSCVPGLTEAMTTGVLVLFALDDLGVGEAGYAVHRDLIARAFESEPQPELRERR
jgi:hypothetical protein